MDKKTVLICGVLSLAALTIGLIADDLEIGVSKEPNTYNIDPTIMVLPSGERVYMAPTGGVLEGKHVVMPNPNAGDLMLNINGPSYTKRIKIWENN